jgi:hypothetical protein
MNGRIRAGWIPGFVVGVAGGLLTLEFPTLGWLIVAVFAIPAAIVGPRAAAIGGLLTGLGGIWLVLLGRVAITCQATGEELGCHAPGIESWLAVGGAMLAIGIVLSMIALVRSTSRRR